MPKMRLDLQEGFNNDDVEILVNGNAVFRTAGVTTKRMLGLALATEVEVPAGPLHIEIPVPTKKLSKIIKFILRPQRLCVEISL
jgi:hypothetical protein